MRDSLGSAMDEQSSVPPPGLFDAGLAARLLGHTLLLGITEKDHQGTFLQRRQVFGRVTVADQRRGICLKSLSDGSDFWLPPDTRGIAPGRPGEYRNRATGEVVKDPDFTGAIVLTKAPPKSM